MHGPSLVNSKPGRRKMPSYKLYYFHFRGRAEITRLAFALGNISYEDVRLDWDQWTKEKTSGRPPFGQMPFLELDDGKILAQSGAICKFVCGLTDLCPSDGLEKAQADMIFDGVEDLRTGMSKFFFEKEEAKKEKLRKDFFEKTLPLQLASFQKLLEANNEGKASLLLSYADINFFDIFNGLMAKGELKVPDQLKPFPLLVEHYNRVMNVPEIKAWIEKRPKTDI